MPALAELGFRPSMNYSTGPDIRTGDFNRLEHADAVYVINTCVKQMHDVLSTEEAIPVVESRVSKLLETTGAFRAYVQDESKYPHSARNTIINRYSTADAETDQKDVFNWAQARLSKFAAKPTLIPDLDGTLTQSVDPATTLGPSGLAERVNAEDYLLKFMPGSSVAEPILKVKGRGAFPEVFVKTWQKVLEAGARTFYDAAEQVKLRPGAEEFFARAKQDNINVTVLSANFFPFVKGVVDKIPDTQEVGVLAVTPDNLIATEKSLVLEDIAKANPDSPVIYLGDGSSDRNAINSFVAVYFALENSEFASELKGQNKPFFTYRSFDDVNRTLQLLGVFSPAPGQVA